MAIRTNVSDVKVIITTALSDGDITSFITSANAIVDQYLSTTELSEATLTEIERWLTAHLISVSRERSAQSEKVGEASVTYSGTFGEGLKSTPYGQHVLLLDSSGTFPSLGRRVATISAITSFD